MGLLAIVLTVIVALCGGLFIGMAIDAYKDGSYFWCGFTIADFVMVVMFVFFIFKEVM